MQSKRPTRRDGKAVERTTQKNRPVRSTEPNDDSAFALLRRQFERVDAQRMALERALAHEKEARAEDAVELGEMMARVSLAEGRSQLAHATALELGTELEEARRAAAEREARHALLRTELENLRGDARRSRAPGPPSSKRGELEASRVEIARLRESLAALQKRAADIGAGLGEMRQIMVQSAALFDELEERERAIGEIRARSLREARAVFLKAAGHDEPRSAPPVPASGKGLMEDLSDAAELLEEEVRASIRPRGGG